MPVTGKRTYMETGARTVTVTTNVSAVIVDHSVVLSSALPAAMRTHINTVPHKIKTIEPIIQIKSFFLAC